MSATSELAVRRSSGITRRVTCGISALLVTLLAAAILLYALGPYLLAPTEDFTQGPGGAMAYSSLLHQIRDQSAAFWSGKEVHLVLSEPEFSGMVSSALLSGRTDTSPIRKVRAGLVNGEIRVESVLRLQNPRLPERFQVPMGLTLRLVPTVGADGLIRFQVASAAAGRVPVPVSAVRLAGRMGAGKVAGFDPRDATISLPLGNVLAAQLGRHVHIAHFAVTDGTLDLGVSLGSPLHK